MRLTDCHNFADFRRLAERRLPSPIFHYIDGAADDEITYRRNTAAYEDVDLVPNVLNGVEDVDMSVEVMGQKLDMPFYCAPTALQRLFHHEGERAVAKAASKFGTMFGVSSLATVTVEEIAEVAPGPKMFQFYFHKDRGLNDALLERARAAKFNVMALTVDTITGGNRERDLRTGFTSPPRLIPSSLFSFAAHPSWAWNFLTKDKFDMPHLSGHVSEGTNLAVSVGEYFSTMLDPTMNWKDAEKLCAQWNGQFALKGIMSMEDAKRAVDIGCTGIMVSNHGGRQL
ncbi:MAG: alpha-hydroxy acid oxidase, partial [Pseudomonadota bacterium]